MTLQQLIYLVTAAECGNMTEAAAKLYISQPSLSAAIRNLEEEMGVTAFSRTNKGITVTREGEELLSYARMLLEQSENMKDHFCNSKHQIPKFSVSCQHYSFAVNAFVDVIKTFDADRYNFIMRETQTGEIIDDVANGKSEIGIIFLSEHNEEILSKLIRNNNLIFEELYVAKPHIFIYKHHPLAKKDKVTLDDLTQYPYLVYEQGTRNSFYFSEEFISTLDFPKIIQVRDRATLFNLVIGLNGFTVSSGIIDHRLNGPHIIAKPLIADQTMHIGIVKKKNMILSRYAHKYIEALKEHLSIV
ncbi:MAG: LysR family transcriptional regulator [Kandleria vitulina]|uniref:LysR family transcriptional regulator n=1 Tax=Kandleria vitulina TaxID=1630 RepID=UPI002E78213A|nr:LysR family transcriptional regulator [Kandleria vitulina]MEE0988216.1 LysR family transcriptional regulator [Kandleria vitulina]